MVNFLQFKSVFGRTLVIASILILGCVFVASLTPTADAAFSGCRADPVIWLSDGSTLDVTVGISTDVTNVKSIAYTVHVPSGVKMTAYYATPLVGFQGKETFTLLADAPAGQYKTDVLVRTTIKNVSVTTYSTLVYVSSSGSSLSIQSAAVNGLSGQHLITTINR